MSRAQVNDNFGGQRLQTQARPIAQVEQTAAPVEDTRWRGLANAFAQGAGLADTLRQQKEVEDKEAATAWAQSMTVGELGKAIKEGKMLPSQSPVFVGTAQHIYGVNTHEAGIRDMTSKLDKGELKFNSPEEADNYLTEWRNTSLAGQSKYAAAGFDKAYPQTRQKFMDAVTRQNDKTWVENAQVQATDYLANGLNKVTSADFKGTPQDAAKAIMADYQLMRQTMTLPEHARKGALQDVVTRLASSGQTSVLTALLDTKMDDIGSLRSFIGETKAATLTNHANSTFDGQQRQRIDEEALPWYQTADKGELNVDALRKWGTSDTNKKYVTSAFINSIENANQASVAKLQRELRASQIEGAIAQSEAIAQQTTLAAFREGNLWRVEGVDKPKVLGKNGEPKDFDVKEFITKAGAAMTANLPFDQQVSAFALNGLEHPDWKNQMQAGYMNLATIKLDAKGKPQGELNEAGKASIALFKQLDSTNTEYTRTLLGENVYKRFSNISFLQHFGKSEAEAASIAANADSGNVIGSDVEKLDKKIHAAAMKLVQPEWYQVGWVQRLRGDNTSANTAQVTGTVRQYASLLVKSGMYGDAESALDAVAQHVTSPQVSAKVNGTLYMRSEMPTGPKSRTQEEWFGRYLSEVVKPMARGQDGKDSQVRLEYDPAAKLYRGYIGGFPMVRQESGEVLMVPKNEIEQWYRAAEQGDVTLAVAEGQKAAANKTYEDYRKRVWGEVGQVQKEQGRFAMERYDGTVNRSGLENHILGPEAHKRIVADGNAGKSLAELMKLYPAKAQ